MKNKFYLIWFVFLLVFTIMIAKTKQETQSTYYEEKIQATSLTIEAYQAIYDYRLEHNIVLQDPTRQDELSDELETGLIGYWLTDITTTSGSLRAKQLSVNPNFAAVVIDMLEEAKVQKGDEVGVVVSGSFPAIAIATICALQTMEMKLFVIPSIGASSYGATIVDFTIVDMFQVLEEASLIHQPIQYVSWGGNDDLGNEYPVETKTAIRNRIEDENTSFLNGGSFDAVVNNRMELFQEELPKMKMFINIGGHFASMGQGMSTFLDDNGLILRTKRLYSPNRGLINRYLEQGMPVIHFINIEDLVMEYDLSLNPESPKIDLESDVYYDEVVQLPLLLVPMIFSLGLFIFLIIHKIKKPKPDVK